MLRNSWTISIRLLKQNRSSRSEISATQRRSSKPSSASVASKKFALAKSKSKIKTNKIWCYPLHRSNHSSWLPTARRTREAISSVSAVASRTNSSRHSSRWRRSVNPRDISYSLNPINSMRSKRISGTAKVRIASSAKSPRPLSLSEK